MTNTTASPLDPRTPVIIGVGQFTHRAATLDEAFEPAALIEFAVRAAAEDAGLDGPPAADVLRVVCQYSWRYGNLPRFVAARLGLEPRLQYTTEGGNTPQTLLNTTAAEIQQGDLDIAILTGGEAFRTRMRARKEGVELPWPKSPADDAPELIGGDLTIVNEAERSLGLWMPVQVYPMFESALRAASGRDIEEHQAYLGGLWSGLSAVAAANPHAWQRTARAAEEITTVGPSNRMIGLPYPKLMNSNNDVDMAAAVIVCSVDAATRLGVPRDRWVFPLAGADCREHVAISVRDRLDRTPAIEVGGRAALDLAGLGIDDVSLIDLYSCFPSAVQLGASSLGIDVSDPSRPWSRTGGLTFAGGPWHNYVMHAIATMVRELREHPGENGLVWGNGGLVTKHSFGVYGTAPPAGGFRHVNPQPEIDRLPTRELADADDAAGPAVIESYTVMHGRDGTPEQAFATCRLADDRRALASSQRDETMAALADGEWVGRTVTLDADRVLHV
ncbi:MAG: acetyl-CoA acetyltransferase [Actinomycetota bacterium]